MLEATNGKICNEKTVDIFVKEDFTSGYHTIRGSFEVADGLRLPYRIENRPTSQCHILAPNHFITYDQQRFEIHEIGDFILAKNHQGNFQMLGTLKNHGGQTALVRVQALDQNEMVTLELQDGKLTAHVDFENDVKTVIKTARNGSSIYVSCQFSKFFCHNPILIHLIVSISSNSLRQQN